MKVEVEIISKETVKPSSPTPDHLRHYGLSFLDQVTIDVYNPMVYYYAADDALSELDVSEISFKLKESLSSVLALYYPLAGRANYAHLLVDCNDEGIPFIEARVKCRLCEVIQHPLPSELNKLVPFQLDELSEVSMGVQLNVFECGGIALGVCLSHKIGDAWSFFLFINAWAAIARGEAGVHPNLTSAELFPPKKTFSQDTRAGITRNRAAKMFVLESSKVESLRAKYSERSAAIGDQKRPSRVEALSAFIYSRFLKIVNEDESSTSDKLFLVLHTVNIRPRMDPPLPDHAFGNYYRTTTLIPAPDALSDELCHGLVGQVRDEVRKIDKEFLEQFKDADKNQTLDGMKERNSMYLRGKMVPFAFTSLCRMPLYEADFGWGKPTWVGSGGILVNNLVVFIDAKDGGGLELYFHLKEEHLAKLEADGEFLQLVAK